MQVTNAKATVTKQENETLRVKSKLKSESSVSVDMTQQAKWMLSIKWKVTFLSTLTHTLFISERLFEDFRVCSPEFVETMQIVIES